MALCTDCIEIRTAGIIPDENKFVTDAYRLSYDRNSLTLEEAPQKGMRRLRKYDLTIWPSSRGRIQGGWLPYNIYSQVEKHHPHSYDEAKSALATYANRLWFEIVRDYHPELEVTNPQYNAYESEVSRMKFVPEASAEPIQVEGKDFAFTSTWKDFEIYSPRSDFQQSDPFYMGLDAASPQSARKLYTILAKNPNALSNVAYDELEDWFRANGIRVKHTSSSWS